MILLGSYCYNGRFQNPGIARKGGVSDPFQDFSGEFDLQYYSVQNSFKIDKIDALFVAKSTSVPGLGGGG